MRSPGFTSVPVSTGIRVMSPDAFDLTSTTLIGSTTPLAWASTTMSRRVTGAVLTVGAFVLLRLHETPSAIRAMAAMTEERFMSVASRGR